MRIHEILEICVEYIAFDGVIGSDPARLLQHLVTLDPTLDHDYFTHIWTLLCAHPSIQIILTTEPILIPGGTTDIGTAPLPDGWVPPRHIHENVDINSLYKEGVRGRQLAYILAGQEFRTDKQAVQDKRMAQMIRAKQLKQASHRHKGDSDDEELTEAVKSEAQGMALVRVLVQDDAEEGDASEPVPKTDLRSLWQKWGARLRIRCTDDEIYYRLTGSHQRIPKITSTVFHILQLAAMSREKGITAIDLGPLVGASQGSMHYYMKVLVGLGLCAKVPAVLHAAITNLLVFHRFLDRNTNYLAIIGKPLPRAENDPAPEAGPGTRPVLHEDDAVEGEDNESGDEQPTDPNVDDLESFDEWGFDFGPITENELMSGLIVKERLLKMLDHPRLRNHLLKARNLLRPIGWTGSTLMRHRRAIKKHIDTLVFEGVVERLEMGNATSCIRLMKYSDRPVEERQKAAAVVEQEKEAEPVTVQHDLELISSQPPYMSPGGVPLTLTFEYIVTELVAQSGLEGMTINTLWRSSDFMYKRAFDFAILRADNAHIPGHLWPRAMSSVMETIGKERRLRLFTTAAYQHIMLASGQELVGYPALPAPDIAGQWADLSYKRFFTSQDQYNRFLDGRKLTSGDATLPTPRRPGRLSASKPRGKMPDGRENTGTPASVIELDDDAEVDAGTSDPRGLTKSQREFKYDNTVQIRGRPRKYVHVVEQDGTVNRRIIGTVYSRPDLPPILIYVKESNVLVVAPPGYAGVGPPPPVTPEMMQDGKPPSYYYQFPTRDPAAFSGQQGTKSKADKEKRRQKQEQGMEKRSKQGKETHQENDSGKEKEAGKVPEAPKEKDDHVVAAAVAVAGDVDVDVEVTGAALKEKNQEGTRKGDKKEKNDKKKGKKRTKGSPSGSGTEGTPSTTRKSKRQKKEVKYSEPAPIDVDEVQHNDVGELPNTPQADLQNLAAPAVPEAGPSNLQPNRTQTSQPEVAAVPVVTPNVPSTVQSAAEEQTPSILTPDEQLVDSSLVQPPPADTPPTDLVVASIGIEAEPAPVEPEGMVVDVEPAPTLETEPEPETQVVEPASLEAASSAPPVDETPAPQTRKSGRKKKEKPPPEPVPDRPKRARKSKAAEIPVEESMEVASETPRPVVTATEARPAPVSARNGATDATKTPTPDVVKQEGTKFEIPPRATQILPSLVVVEDFLHLPMESTIGTVLTELAESGIRPRSTAGTPAPLDTNMSTGQKRKALASVNVDTPTRPPKAKKGGVTDDKEGSSKVHGTAPLFTLPEVPMDETPFELPPDIVATPKLNIRKGREDQLHYSDAALDPLLSLDHSTGSGKGKQREVQQRLHPEESFREVSNQVIEQSSVTDLNQSLPPQTTGSAAAVMPPPPASATPIRRTSLAATPDLLRSRSQTPLRQMSLDNHGFNSTPIDRSRSRSNTPLYELTHPIKNHRLLHAIQGPKPNNNRIDLGNIRRANEIVQVLTVNGGVLVDTRLLHEHRAWAYKYAGTDHPHAPATAYQMDRTIVKKTIHTLLNEGRVKETIVTIPTPTGRWVKSSVIYLADLPQEQLQAYIRLMSTNMTQAMTPTSRKDKGTASLPHTPYTEIKQKTPSTGRGVRVVANVTPTQHSRIDHIRPFSERRMALLKELKVVSQLYGWKAGRGVRVQTLYRAMLKAFNTFTSTSVMSTSPRIFAVPLLTEEITAGEWFSVVLAVDYNEEIEEWLRDPANRAMKVKDVPKRYQPRGGFAGSSTKKKLTNLLQVLTTLKLITPVAPVAKEEAEFFSSDSDQGGYKTIENAASSTFYMIHDYVPVYHLASTPPPLLGILPARTEVEVDKLWETIKLASLESRVDLIGRIDEQMKPGLPSTAKLEDVLDIPLDQLQMFQRSKRWKDELELVAVQSTALSEVVNLKTGQCSLKTKEEMDNFAYENALPPAYVESEIKRRLDAASNRADRVADRLRATALKAQERQEKLQDAIRQKLLDRQEAARRQWERRVEALAQRKGVTYDAALLQFVSRHTLLSGSMKRVEATDLVIDNWITTWMQTQGMTEHEREKVVEERRRQVNERRGTSAPKLKRVRHRQSTRKPKGQKPTGRRPATRTKIKWTHEDDELFLDAEAIIRARSRASTYRGRAAMSQVYPNVSTQTFLSRIKKITAQPGKKAYFERLEQAWYDVWMEYRGTAELEDEHPDSSTEFNLQKHVEFLRAKIDKKPLKLLAAAMPVEEQEPAPDLPADLSKILEDHQWSYVQTEDYSFEAIENSNAAEEIRINVAGAISLHEGSKAAVKTELGSKAMAVTTGLGSKDMGVLQAALKMIVGTPTSIYDPVDGNHLLSQWDVDVYDAAIDDMVAKNILTRHRASAATGGRFFDFSQQWDQINQGPLAADLAQDAHGLEVKLEKEETVDWPIIGRAGELAALMNMVSNDEVDFDFDITEFPTIKYETGHYNTRKLNDDAFEFDFKVKKLPTSASPVRSANLPDLKVIKPLSQWSVTPDPSSILDETVERVLQAVHAAGPHGVTKSELLSDVIHSERELAQSLAKLANRSIAPDSAKPAVFWTGYDTARLVSRDHWEQWATKTHPRGLRGEVEVLTNPRRWSDLYGSFRKDDWEEAVNAVKVLVVTRPGITHLEIRTRLSPILDRLELVEVLEYLQSNGSLQCTWSAEEHREEGRILPPVEAVGVDEEESIAWLPFGERVW